MSIEGPPPVAPRPSVFISYASEDRAAARTLRDTLAAAGLDVWYDESDLGGGDAWDQKIRRQIRDCDYFLAVISANTERRKEGYFRREWRLATERTLDMADDVLFLLPVVIDGTSEQGARVPEKFLSVQWLRAPRGEVTPALHAVIQRLLAGDHTIGSRPPLMARPVKSPPYPSPPPLARAPAGATAVEHVPPPMPPFPTAPEKGGIGPWCRFVAETIWWAITAVWLVFSRLPKWLRVLLAVWLVFTLLSTCGRNSSPRSSESPRRSSEATRTPSKEATARDEKEVEQAVAAVAAQVSSALKGTKQQDWGKFAEDIARRLGKTPAATNATGKPLVLVPFVSAGEAPEATQFTQQVFATCYGRLLLARAGEAAVASSTPATTDDGFAKIGQELSAGLVLGFRIAPSADGAALLSVRLLRPAGSEIVWSADYPIAAGDAAVVGVKVADAVIAAMPAQ